MGIGTRNKKGGNEIIYIVTIALLLVGLSVTFYKLKDNSRLPDKLFKLEEQDIILFLEAVTRIKEDAVFLTSGIPREKIVQDTLKSYLARKDFFSEYLSREEFLKFKEKQDEEYIGIGLEIQKDHKGRIICFPYPDSPAEKHGISVGDQLKSINQISVFGKSIFTVSSEAMGKRGTNIQLTFKTKNGMEKRVVVTRSEMKFKSISKRRIGTMDVLQISYFSRNTKGKLKDFLNNWKIDYPIIIDLRGNAGGDLHAAIDSAMLFLEKGSKITTIQTRNGSIDYESNNRAKDLSKLTYLWQDDATASAAEVFIAALTENNKAVSIGKRTFGKGTKQDIIELSDGSALILTTGHLKTPKGSYYQGNGLNPTYELYGTVSNTLDYLSKVKELMSLRK